MHRIHYKQNNIASNFYKTTTSIHQQHTRCNDEDSYYIQPTNLSLGRKAVKLTGPIIWATISQSLKNIHQKHLQKSLRTFQPQNIKVLSQCTTKCYDIIEV